MGSGLRAFDKQKVSVAKSMVRSDLSTWGQSVVPSLIYPNSIILWAYLGLFIHDVAIF